MRTSSSFRRDMIVAIVGIAVLLALILLSFMKFSRDAFAYSDKVNEKRLAEFSSQVTESLRNELNAARQYIRIAAAAVAEAGGPASERAEGLMRDALVYNNFTRVWLVDGDARGRTLSGKTAELSGQAYFPDLAAGRSGISDRLHSLSTGKEVICVYAPIPGHEGGIVGVYDTRSLVARTQKRLFEGKAYSSIFRNDGQLVVRSPNLFNTMRQENVIDFLQSAEFAEGFDPAAFRKGLDNWSKGIFHYRHDGNNYLLSHEPLGINGWHVLTVAPQEVIDNDSRAIDDMALGLIGRVMACLGALVAGILYYGNKSRKAILRANRLLDINNQRFRIAAFHLSNDVVEYDVQNDLVYRVDEDSETSKPIADLADGLIRDERISDEYIPLLRKSMEHIKQGKPYESCVVKTRRPDGDSGWYKVVFTGIADEEKQPVKAVGTIENVTAQRNTEIRFSLEEQQRRAMLAEATESYVFNITGERFLYGYGKNDKDTPLRTRPDYMQQLKAIVAEKIHPDFQEKALQDLSPRHLKEIFSTGGVKTEVELRAADRPDGGERWYNCLVNLVLEPESHDLIGYAYLRDVTETKLREMALEKEALRDPLTGLYNRLTTNRFIEEFLRTPGAAASGYSAFLLIDLDRFKEVNDNYGHAAGDEVLIGLAERIRKLVRNSDIVGRMGGDEFVVLLKNFTDVHMVESRAEQICAALKKISFSADPDYRVSGSVGVYIVPAEGAKLTELYERADLALYAAKEEGKDRYKFYDPKMRHRSERR